MTMTATIPTTTTEALTQPVLVSPYLKPVNPEVQREKVAAMARMYPVGKLMHTLVQPVMDAVHALNKRRSPQEPALIAEPILWDLFSAKGHTRDRMICMTGRDRFSRMTGRYETTLEFDQVGIRREGDPYYSAVISLGWEAEFGKYYITSMAWPYASWRDRKAVKCIDPIWARSTRRMGNLRSVVKCVADTIFITPTLLAHYIWKQTPTLARNLCEYFHKEVETLKRDAIRDMTYTPRVAAHAFDLLLSLATEDRPVSITNPELYALLTKFDENRRELQTQSGESLVSDYVVMVAAFGADPRGYVFGIPPNSGQLNLRAMQTLDALPQTVAARVQTVYMNKGNLVGGGYGYSQLPGVGGTMNVSGIVAPDTDCIAVLVTEEEFRSIFHG